MSEGNTGRDDRSHWQARYSERGPELDRAPSEWVIDRCLAMSRDALFFDIAGGTGRHAVALAREGRRVVVMDFVFAAVRAATGRHPRISGVVGDVRACPVR